MKLITFLNKEGKSRAGWLQGDQVVDMNLASSQLPDNMLAFIEGNEDFLPMARDLEAISAHYDLADVRLQAPLPNPRSIRDHVAFEQHMLNASKAFGHNIGKAWYDVPIFYFTNHHAIYGTGDEIVRPDQEVRMDMELEIAAVIGKKGRNIPVGQAEDHIFGYTIFNDWTARSIQKHEMEVPLGPHKGKDFANAFGPCIVTKDEFESKKVEISRATHPQHLTMPATTGDRFDLKMEARINGEVVCQGNYQTVHWTFPQMVERASENHVDLLPGDILGSGTVGWGSLIENKFEVHRPLQPGDEVALEIEGIGVLRNKVV